MRDNFGQASRRRPRRCEAQVLAVRADQENEAGVVDFGPGIPRRIGLGVIDLVGQRDLLDSVWVAREADEPGVKQRDVALELVGRVLFRIDGDEQWLDRVPGTTVSALRRYALANSYDFPAADS